MLKSTKFYSSLAASLLLSTSLIVPVTHAKTIDQKDPQVIREFQQFRASQHPLPHYFKAQTFSAAAISTQVEYKQPIQSYQVHHYLFSTNGGTFTVNTLNTSDALNYSIFNQDTFSFVDASSTGDFSLPAGNYIFLVGCTSDQPITYDYQLNGPFSEEPDGTLPTLNISSPTSHLTNVAKGASNVFSITGSSTNADTLTLSNNDSADQDFPTTGAFTQNETLGIGINDMFITATGKGGNYITTEYWINAPGISRLQGKDRYEVSSNISQELFLAGESASRTIIIARGDVFSDALSAGPLAREEDAPILLTATNSLPDSVAQQIQNLMPTKAIILGGTGSVSTKVESQLKDLGVTTIDRISGKDRFAVGASVGERISAADQTDSAIIASGEVFPDALSANSIAGPLGMPVLLVQSGTVPDSIQTYITNHPEVTHFIVVGGTATVNDSVISKIKELRSGALVERISGTDRYDVSVKVAEYGMQHYGMDLSNVAIARGDLFPDALSGAAFANYIGAPILLTPTSKVDPQVSSFLTGHSSEIDNMFIFGGTGSVSQNAEDQLNQIIK